MIYANTIPKYKDVLFNNCDNVKILAKIIYDKI